MKKYQIHFGVSGTAACRPTMRLKEEQFTTVFAKVTCGNCKRTGHFNGKRATKQVRVMSEIDRLELSLRIAKKRAREWEAEAIIRGMELTKYQRISNAWRDVLNKICPEYVEGVAEIFAAYVKRCTKQSDRREKKS